MQIEILFFGITADIATKKSIHFEINDGCSTKDLRDKLSEEFPKLSELKSYAIAINMEYADENKIINKGDVIALIPPVSGG